MGASKSKVESEVINNFTNTIVNRSLTINENIMKNLGLTTQNARLKVVRSDVECTSGSTGIDQKASANIKVLRDVSNVDIQEAKTEVENQLSVDNEQSNEMIQEFLGGIGMKNDQETSSKVKTDIKNTILNEMTTKNVNKSINSIKINQDGTIEIIDSKYKGPCTITQDALIDMQLSELVENITEKIIDSSTLTEADVAVKQTSKLEQKGPSLFGSLGMFILIALIIFIGIPLLPFIMIGRKGMLIGLIIAIIVFLTYIGISYAIKDRAPWEPTCPEKCKDTCPEGDSECVPCIECPEYCPGNCENCEVGSDDCYTCEQCDAHTAAPSAMRVNRSNYI
ncbi:hypothetical protein OAV62_01650 [bacterium]|nr:hypothetical protein [bacterium]